MHKPVLMPACRQTGASRWSPAAVTPNQRAAESSVAELSVAARPPAASPGSAADANSRCTAPNTAEERRSATMAASGGATGSPTPPRPSTADRLPDSTSPR
eukprot:scaffold18987_cov109-Isochrysis_galbana.AAC.21